MRTWMLDDIKNSLNFRDVDDKPNYTHVVGLLFADEIKYLKTLNIEVNRINNSYNQVVFKSNFNK